MSQPVKFVSVPSKTLATSMNSGAYTLQVSDILGWDGAALTSADFGSEMWAVLRDSTNTFMELIQIDPTTIANSSITILKRGLDFSGDSTEIPANMLTWVKNDTIVELGSNPPQLFKAVMDYIDSIAIAGAPTADTSTKGLVQVSTQAQVDAKTATGSTGASLTVTPALLRATKYYDYAADGAGTDTYAITLTPVISAYSAGDVFLFKAQVANTGAASLNVNAVGSIAIKNRVGGDLVTGDILAGQMVFVSYDGTNMVMLGRESIKFGGNATDGALAVSSGTTTISASSAAVLAKNYSSIAITGTGAVQFTTSATNGTTIVLKSQGNVTLTSSAAPMLDASSMGAVGGAAVVGTNNYTGNDGNPSYGFAMFSVVNGTKGTASTGGTDSTAPTAINPANVLKNIYSYKYPFAVPGSGGASGGSAAGTGTYTSGAGGNGGGCLIIECGGAWNFTTASGISVAGQNGGNGTVTSAGNTGTGGGGGGGGGVFIAFYNSLTANSGTVTITQGTTGTVSGSGGHNGGAGGSIIGTSAGYSYIALNTEYA